MEQLAPGLRRWTSWHDHWEEDVGSVAVETDDGLVLIDPNDPPAELGKPAHVLLTVYWHARGTKELRRAACLVGLALREAARGTAGSR